MKAVIRKMLQKFNELNISDIESAFVATYLHQKDILIEECNVLKEYISCVENIDKRIFAYIDANFILNEIDDLIGIFELLIDPNEKKSNGMVYTPYNIKQYIVKNAIASDAIPVVVDPACGCGSFLITAAQWMHQKYGVGYADIFEKYIVGFDIDVHSIQKAQILFNILSLEEGDDAINEKTNLYVVNSLEELSNKKYREKFDVVIGNPPYVRAKNIDETIKESLKNWSVVSGNVDLYIPFYQLAISILKPGGIMGYISPNTFLQSVNGRSLRNHFVELGAEIKIIDFRENQRFYDVTHYTCICMIYKNVRSHHVKYALCDEEISLDRCNFTDYDVKDNLPNQEWRFRNVGVDSIIHRIERQPYKLDDYKIRNGLATLSNDIYFFDSKGEDEHYFYREYVGKMYPIEKEICIDVAKPNIMRTEKDLEELKEKAIFPYKSDHTVIAESIMASKYPMAYAYLLANKDRLLKRDKGKAKDYPAWYAYGRTQGMSNQGKKLLIPYMAERGVAIKSNDENLLFYCGYALFFSNDTEMTLIKMLIESKVFWYYIENTSKPYSKGYMALAKNYIKNFGVPQITEEQRSKLFQIKNQEEREKMIAGLYGVPDSVVTGF